MEIKQLFDYIENNKVSQCQKNQRGILRLQFNLCQLWISWETKEGPFCIIKKPLPQTEFPVHVISGIRYNRLAVNLVVCLTKETPLHFKCRMYIAQRDFTKIKEFLLELFLENHDYSRSFLKKNAVKPICLSRIIPDSFQIGRNRSTSYFEWNNWNVFSAKMFFYLHDDLTFLIQ